MGKVNKRTLTIHQLEVRTVQGNESGTEGRTISGYAIPYNSESELLYGFFREKIMPGAFDKSLGGDIRCLWDHNSAYVLGRTTAGTLDLRSDAKGLYFEVNPPETTWANDLCTSIERGDINQMSFGFNVNEDGDTWSDLEDGTVLREVNDGILGEISIVSFPAYTATSAGVRSLDQDIEKAEDKVKKRYEERTKDQPSEPDKRFFDYFKMMKAYDFRSTKGDSGKDADSDTLDVDGDPDADTAEEEEETKKDQKTRSKGDAEDDADGGVDEDPGSEADDPNNEDTTDGDENDEDEEDESDDNKRNKKHNHSNHRKHSKRGMDGAADDETDDLDSCDDCGIIAELCPECGCCQDCCLC